MNRQITFLVTMVGTGIAFAFVAGYLFAGQDEAVRIRIGIYDNRAIAVAYAASSFNPVREKMTEYNAAKEAGEQKKVDALQKWGEQHQRKLHFQGFGCVPVSDLLEPVKPQLLEIAKAERLSAIVMVCDFTAPDVEVVDVTGQLVELFNPTGKTRQMAREICKHEPVSLTKLADLPAKH